MQNCGTQTLRERAVTPGAEAPALLDDVEIDLMSSELRPRHTTVFNGRPSLHGIPLWGHQLQLTCDGPADG